MKCNGVELSVCTAGERSAPPLLLIHGNGEDHTIFDEAVELLSHRYFVIAPDSRGHGASQPVEKFRYREMAQDMAALLDALDVQNTAVFGFSDGGIIGLLMAIYDPQRVGRLIAAGANTHPFGVGLDCLRGVAREYLQTRDGKQLLMLTQPWISRAQLRRIRVPVCILAGEHDLIRPAHTRRMAACIPGAQMHFVPGEDHGSYIVHSVRFVSEARL